MRRTLNTSTNRVTRQNHRARKSSYQLIMQQLTTHYRDNEFDAISKLPSFKLIERRDFNEDKLAKRDCIWYITQKKETATAGLFSFSAWHPEGYCHIPYPQPEDLVIYHRHVDGQGENHIGIYRGNDRVDSKWGYGHIYNHPINTVPEDYGPYLSFFTKQKNPALGDYATIHNMEDWISVYGAICYLRMMYASGFSQQIRNRIDKELKQNPQFSYRGGGGQFSLDNSIDSYSYSEYRIIDGYLDKIENRQRLKSLYRGESETLEDISAASKDITTVKADNKKRKHSLYKGNLPDKIAKNDLASKSEKLEQVTHSQLLRSPKI